MNLAEKNVALLRTAYNRLMQHKDLDESLELLTDDFIANIPGLDEPRRGRDAWRFGVEAMHEAFPDLRVEIENIFSVGDEVAVRLRFSGTHKGTFQGIEPTHRTVNFRSLEHYRVVGDKIAEEWVAPDIASLMRQLGIQ
ncbi:ester cyclase [Nocardia donostiensis]|uniref:Ester cyclase n=1 Tax=Nocardia donostiensis TaxID=1538463 RepID=A0A1W0AQA8_9NOCA|nr:ester cyclase [Nocardia donostiensis]ONM46623.1 ester cyclase [Nocardia donostiensis]OQS12361.1 ester cyclase [Nocardia donostiensis]OQS19063.1 ester cyclase [Nocardia donostiensis]